MIAMESLYPAPGNGNNPPGSMGDQKPVVTAVGMNRVSQWILHHPMPGEPLFLRHIYQTYRMSPRIAIGIGVAT